MRGKGDNCGSYTFSIKVVICRIGLTSFDINVVLNIMAFEKKSSLAQHSQSNDVDSGYDNNTDGDDIGSRVLIIMMLPTW